MGGCMPVDNTRSEIYRVNIPQFIDPIIENQPTTINKFRQSVCCSVTKDYFDSTQEQGSSKQIHYFQSTATFSAQKMVPEQEEINMLNAKMEQFKQKYTKCIQLYYIHQIDKANRLATQLLLLLTQQQIENSAKIEKQLLKIQNQYQKVNNFEKEVTRPGWEFKGEEKGIRVSSRRETDTVAVLIEAQINIPVEILAAVLTEVDLFYKFVPWMESSKELKVCARNAKIGHCINNLPLISKRQAFFFGIGYDRLQHNGSIFIYTQSLLQNQDLMKQHNYYPQTTKGAVQLDYKYLIFQYIPKDNKSGLVRLAINVDMKLPYVPMFILDPATRQFGHDFFKNMVKISKNFENSEWKTKVSRRPDLFNFFKNRVQEYVKSS